SVSGGAIAGVGGVTAAVALAGVGAWTSPAAIATGIGAGPVVFAFIIIVDAAVVASAARAISIKRGWHGNFLAAFTLMMFLVCFAIARYLSLPPDWEHRAGPFLLFFGLLTLVNAPFDWLSLGLTRALLRQGSNLEAGGLIFWHSWMRVSPPSSSRFSR